MSMTNKKREVIITKEFTGAAIFEAIRKAEAFLKENGYSIERGDGTITGDMRRGPVKIEIYG
jgi:hypothetical protein